MQITRHDFSNQRDPLLEHSNGELVQPAGSLGNDLGHAFNPSASSDANSNSLSVLIRPTVCIKVPTQA
jgi:hypothetical protein